MMVIITAWNTTGISNRGDNMNLLSSFLGAPKVVSLVADTVKSGMGMIDNAFYTKQEKAADASKVMTTWLAIQTAIAQENSVRSITRRLLAWSVMGLFLFLILIAAVVWKLDAAWSVHIKELIVETRLMYLAMIVGFFYFGSYGIGTLIKK